MYPPNEENLIETLLVWLRDTKVKDYKIITRPDSSERQKPDIDYLLGVSAPELAVEVSTLWRSPTAGKEDSYWSNWTEDVRQLLRSRIEGSYWAATGLELPQGFKAGRFAEELLNCIKENKNRFAQPGLKRNSLVKNICGLETRIGQMSTEGGDISFGRTSTIAAEGNFSQFVKVILDKKSPKLKRYKQMGLETWLLLYNTIWPLRAPNDFAELINTQLTNDHAHIDHVAIVAGNPPDDAWLDFVR